MEALVSDELGLLSLSRAEMGRNAWRKLARSSEMERLLPLSIEEGRALVGEAVRCNLVTRTPFPPDSDVALRHLGIVAATEELPPLPVVVVAAPPPFVVVFVVVLLLLPHAASPRASAPVISTARPNGLILPVTSSPFLTELDGQP